MSPYQHAAAIRWSQHDIFGDGPWAVVDNARGTVRLHELALLAANDLSDHKTLVELKPFYGHGAGPPHRPAHDD